MEYTLDWLMKNDGFTCACGKRHFGLLKDCLIGEGALGRLPEMVRKHGGTHPFVLCDRETYDAAGERVCALLQEAEIPYTLHIIRRTKPAPDERIVGEAVMFCDAGCDFVIAVGGGVINDTGKILSALKACPDIYVSTAPSMDGFASASSSMEREGLKVSLNSRCPDVVIGDADILAAAPVHMIRSGIGDMTAKYISLVEWQIAALLIGEYYCPAVAELVKRSLAVCVENGAAAVAGDKTAVCRLTEGLVMSGLAMNYAGISRPASGLEHYFSHLWEMMALDRGTDYELHGIQVGVGTLITLKLYDDIRNIKPSREVAEKFINEFSNDEWEKMIRDIFGQAADTVIKQEYAIFHKNDKDRHAARLTKILDGWNDILRFIDEELPETEKIAALMKDLGMPMIPADIDISDEDTVKAFIGSRDIRDKYLSSTMLWDLGLLYTTKLPE